jgi:hypothetical protein
MILKITLKALLEIEEMKTPLEILTMEVITRIVHLNILMILQLNKYINMVKDFHSR